MKRFRMSKKYWIILSASVLAVAILAGSAFAIFKFLSSPVSPPTGNDKQVEKQIEKAPSGKFNVLFIGVDEAGVLTDSIMLFNIDKDNNKINITSIPRDTKVMINGTTQKINACNAYGGLELLVSEIKRITGVPINYYALTRPEGFAKIIDILGGVDVTLEKRVADIPAGSHHLNGKQAETYVRYRQYLRGDLDRTLVQQSFMKALIQQKLKPQYILKAPALYNEIKKYITTNVTPADILKNMNVAKLFTTPGAITTYEVDGVPKMINHISYFIIDEEAALKLGKDHFMGTGVPAKNDTDFDELKQ